jgi:hypothetical protein
MKSVVRVVAGVATLCLMLLGIPAAAAGSKPDRVGGFDADKMVVRIDKAGGKDRWVKVNDRTRVVLVDQAGKRVRGDLDDLVRGARVVGSKIAGGKARAVSLKEVGSTGATDCSFDSSDDDGDAVGDDDSFDCSHDYDDGEVDTDSDCSYDSSLDGPANDWSMDTSWDCSYSESTDDDRDSLEWGCGYEAAAGGEEESGEGEVEAELEFECEWSGASTDSVLWDCKFQRGVLGFTCVSAQLGQEFGYTIDLADARFDGGMDFNEDVVTDEESAPHGVGCEGSAAEGYECEVEGEVGAGDCEVEWAFDRGKASKEGEVSGELSYSCSWESESESESDSESESHSESHSESESD